MDMIESSPAPTSDPATDAPAPDTVVAEIRALWVSGLRPDMIARQFQLTEGAVRSLCEGKGLTRIHATNTDARPRVSADPDNDAHVLFLNGFAVNDIARFLNISTNAAYRRVAGLRTPRERLPIGIRGQILSRHTRGQSAARIAEDLGIPFNVILICLKRAAEPVAEQTRMPVGYLRNSGLTLNGGRVAEARMQLGLSQTQLAQAVNETLQELRTGPGSCTKRLVQKWEHGEHALPQPHYQEALSQIFGVSIEALCEAGPQVGDEIASEIRDISDCFETLIKRLTEFVIMIKRLDAVTREIRFDKL